MTASWFPSSVATVKRQHLPWHSRRPGASPSPPSPCSPSLVVHRAARNNPWLPAPFVLIPAPPSPSPPVIFFLLVARPGKGGVFSGFQGIHEWSTIFPNHSFPNHLLGLSHRGVKEGAFHYGNREAERSRSGEGGDFQGPGVGLCSVTG